MNYEITESDEQAHRLPPTHPGDVLREDFLVPMNLTGYRLAKEIGISQTHISDILTGQRSVTANIALRLAAYLGTSAEVWMRLQEKYDLAAAREKYAADVARITPAQTLVTAVPA